jgi:hypothetical protein
MSKKYFAYGSNLNKEQMTKRTPFASSVGQAYIDGWRLVFRGVADIEPHEGGTLAVGLWNITKPDEENLDIYEGYPRLYRKEKILGMMTYRMNSVEIVPPYEDYFNTILQGYKDFGLDTDLLYEALDDSWMRKTRADVW